MSAVRSRGRAGIASLLAAALAAGGCASRFGVNFLDPRGPRCVGVTPSAAAAVPAPDGTLELTVVSYNIKFAKRPDLALRTLRRAGLAQADVLLLQEMDLEATRWLAGELGLSYVYYPGALHPATGRPFGVAVLARWPIRNDGKLLVPLIRSRDDARKISMVATVWVHGVPLGVLNVHLQSGLAPIWMADQLQLLTHCALVPGYCPQPGPPRLAGLRHVLVGGDFNSSSAEHVQAAREVLRWAGLRRVETIGRTMKLIPEGRLDHLFVSEAVEVLEAGNAGGFFGSGSDHYPLWARLRLVGLPADRAVPDDERAPLSAPCDCLGVGCPTGLR